MVRMRAPESFRNQDLDTLSYQFFASVSKSSLNLRIHVRDSTLRIGHDDGVRREFE